MANAKTCDRCNKDLPAGAEAKKLGHDKPNGCHIEILRLLPSGFSEAIYDMDLCFDCRLAFVGLMDKFLDGTIR